MVNSHISNQTVALASLFAAAIGILAVIISTCLEAINSILILFVILDLIAWALVPLYIKRIKWSYIIGVILAIISIIAFSVMLGSFHKIQIIIYEFLQILVIVILLVLLYFSYSSFKKMLSIDKRVQKRNQPRFEIYKDVSGQYRFRLRASNNEIIAVSEAYTSKVACRNGIKSVKKNASKAFIQEE